ncbi:MULTISPECIES: NapC/NirT family cytochrome c [Anaerolinea]|uniref:NapC/NirT family cytochrome c n=1 Tax=Anaerolinea TaxID=233189 RepID=UPI002626B498|nr:NapC/NirT family cytochrome c [Anaerolinea thermophila]
MPKLKQALNRFFFPPATASLWIRLVPFIVVAFLVIVLMGFASFAWEESNSPSFCGLTCHTMPPEYITYQASPHTNVTCEDCHMGRDRLPVMIGRKISYSWQTGTAMLTGRYEYPIVAKNMRPARDACENCHKPEKFSTDTLVEIKRFAEDEANTPTSIFLVVKTGGGSQREGLGYGIHWHIENPVYFYAVDRERQNIPYVMVQNPDGSKTEYVDIESGFNPSSIQPEQLQKMDCITCHNRTAHAIPEPSRVIDQLLARGMISAEIPAIKRNATAILSASYTSQEEALQAIEGLKAQYQTQYADFMAQNANLLDQAVEVLKATYQQTNFPEQKVNWQTHPDNAGHVTSPGCFRCHDGKHLTAQQEAIRLECNLCHSIPVVSSSNQITANLQLNKGFEPESHKNPNWITLHRNVFDQTCAGCHTVEDAGGTSDTSFCSNSACHGASWTFAGFDAPKLRAVLEEQVKLFATPTPKPEEEPASYGTGIETNITPTPVPSSGKTQDTYQTLQDLFKAKCNACHGSNAMKGLNVLDYNNLMKGSTSGAVILPGDPDNSLLVKVQKGQHPGKFTMDELTRIERWILNGAPEK